jgi:hypothetical protein
MKDDVIEDSHTDLFSEKKIKKFVSTTTNMNSFAQNLVAVQTRKLNISDKQNRSFFSSISGFQTKSKGCGRDP